MEELVLMSSVSMLSLMPLLTELLSSQLDKSHAGNGHSYENGIAKESEYQVWKIALRSDL